MLQRQWEIYWTPLTPSDPVVDALAHSIRSGARSLSDPATTEGWVFSGAQAVRVLAAAITDINWHATIIGDLVIESELPGRLWIAEDVYGNIRVVSGGKVNGNLSVCGATVHGELRVDWGGEVAGSVTVQDGGSVWALLILRHAAIGRNVVVVRDSCVLRNLAIKGGSRVTGDLVIAKSATVYGGLVFDTGAEIDGEVAISDGGSVRGDLILAGDVTSIAMSSEAPLRIAKLRGRGSGPVVLGEGCSLEHCDFRQFTRFEQLALVGSDLFQREHGRTILEESPNDQPISHQELATLYRRFRLRLEKQGNRPGASDFYFREMEHRRGSLKDRGTFRARVDRFVLTVYRSISAYGTRAWPAACWFTAVGVLGSITFAFGGINLQPTYDVSEGGLRSGWDWAERGQMVMFTVRSMASFIRPPEGDLSAPEDAIQLGLRFLGPVLLAQFLLAIRDRTAR